MDGVASFTCLCELPYSGPTCAEVLTPCSPNPCANHALCTHTADYLGYQCKCQPGWQGKWANFFWRGEGGFSGATLPLTLTHLSALSLQVSCATWTSTSACRVPARTAAPAPTNPAASCAPAGRATPATPARPTSTTAPRVSDRAELTLPSSLAN